MDKSGCIQLKVDVIGKKLFHSVKVVVFGQKWLYSDKSGCIRVIMVVFGQKSLYSGKSGYIRTKVVVFGKGGCIQAKVVVFV